jgi:hypothetical protein
MDKSADRDAGDPDRALRRRRFLAAAGGGLVLGGLLTGCNFSHGAGTGNSSTTTTPGAGSTASTNPLSGTSGNSSS